MTLSPTMSDFDVDDFLTPVGVGATMDITADRISSPVGVGRAPPRTVPVRNTTAFVGVGTGKRRRPRRRGRNDVCFDESSPARGGGGGGPQHMSQEELKRQLELLSNDQIQEASGRRIAGITTTNTITTTYKDGGRPQVTPHSSRVSH